VDDGGWYDALRALADRPEERARLATDAQAWGSAHLFASVADIWERFFVELAGPDAAPALPGQTPASAKAVMVLPPEKAALLFRHR
jgi:hypothetical protein